MAAFVSGSSLASLLGLFSSAGGTVATNPAGGVNLAFAAVSASAPAADCCLVGVVNVSLMNSIVHCVDDCGMFNCDCTVDKSTGCRQFCVR